MNKIINIFTSFILIVSTFLFSGCGCNKSNIDNNISTQSKSEKCRVTIDGFDSKQGYVEGDGKYNKGSVIKIQAFANEGYEFDSWSDGITSNPRELTVNSNRHFTPRFKKINLKLDYVEFIFDPLGSLNDDSDLPKINIYEVSLNNLSFIFEEGKELSAKIDNDVIFNKDINSPLNIINKTFLIYDYNNKFIYKSNRTIKVSITLTLKTSSSDNSPSYIYESYNDQDSNFDLIIDDIDEFGFSNKIELTKFRKSFDNEYANFNIYLRFKFSKLDD